MPWSFALILLNRGHGMKNLITHAVLFNFKL